jgi:hypothetical protein
MFQVPTNWLILLAKEIDALAAEEDRKTALTEFVLADLPHVSRWLARVQLHMGNTREGASDYGVNKTFDSVPVTEDDFTYLSRFQFTRTCEKEAPVVWYEWIEPLTVHARHPYSLIHCMGRAGSVEVEGTEVRYKGKTYHTDYALGLINSDYIIMQNGHGFEETIRHNPPRKYREAKRYFYDLGTSMFESSLVWFTCMYTQVLLQSARSGKVLRAILG